MVIHLLGSSPLTRGKPVLPIQLRICAWAHPRSRGENVSHAVPLALFLGSSPLTRGKLDETLDEALTGGLIPAHAGKT